MPTTAQLIAWLATESGQLPTLESDFAAIGSAVGIPAKIKAVQALTDEVFLIVETFPFDVPTVAAAEVKASAVNWGGLLAFLEGLLPIILPLIVPKPAA